MLVVTTIKLTAQSQVSSGMLTSRPAHRMRQSFEPHFQTSCMWGPTRSQQTTRKQLQPQLKWFIRVQTLSSLRWRRQCHVIIILYIISHATCNLTLLCPMSLHPKLHNWYTASRFEVCLKYTASYLTEYCPSWYFKIHIILHIYSTSLFTSCDV